MRDHVLVGDSMGKLIGTQLTNLGPVSGAVTWVGSSNLSDSTTVPGNVGTAYLMVGTPTTGPFAGGLTAYRSGGSNLPGQVLFGGGFSGLDTSVSIIGDSKPDIALSGQVGSMIDIVDGAKIGTLPSPLDTAALADVHVPMPAGWTGTAAGTRGLMRDVNNDGFPDFAVGDVFGTVPGRVAVFW
jgi:hypothetical protein